MRLNTFSRSLRSALLVCLFALATGCGGGPTADYGSLGLVQIGGTVTLDGQPLGGAALKFLAPDGSYCTGVTDSSGHYTMMFDSRKSGVIPGEKVVQISSRTPQSETGRQEEDPDAKPEQTETIPACYNRDSILIINVTDSDSAIDFDLKSDCSTTTFR